MKINESCCNSVQCPKRRLEHEVASDSLVTTFASNPSVLSLEPGFHLGKKPRVTQHQFKVDCAFAADDTNDTVYDAVAKPCIDLALKVSLLEILSWIFSCAGRSQLPPRVRADGLGKDFHNQRNPSKTCRRHH